MAHLSLFSRFAIEVLVVGLGILSGMMDDTIPMIRRRIEGIEFQWSTAGVDNVVICPDRDNYCEAGADRRPNAIKNRFSGPLLNAKELIELVDFRTDLFLGLYRHEDELAVLCRVDYLTELVILDSEIFYILHKTFHNDSLFVSLPSVSVRCHSTDAFFSALLMA
jgi:hypothetical protein